MEKSRNVLNVEDPLARVSEQRLAAESRLEFTTGGWPYGGTGALWGLVEAFGARVVAEDDGFSPRAV